MFRNWRDHELVLQVNPDASKGFAPEVLSQMKADFDSVQGRYSGSGWTRLSAEAMALRADNELPSGFRVFRDLYAGIYRGASAFVHSDVRSIQAFFKEDAEGLSIRRPSTPEQCAAVMYAANFIMFAMCWVVTGSFHGKKFVPAWNDLLLEWDGTPRDI